jgi:membrane associated rhomboid family serine protease
VFPLKDNIPTDRFPVVTVALIAINVAMYLLFQNAGFNSPDEANIREYGAYPCEVTGECGQQYGDAPVWLSLLSSMFMHGGILHIAGNMIFLWVFGNNVEDSMGPLRFIGFYLLGGLAALGLQTAVDPSSAIPTIGASGAVAGVLGGYLLLYPRARVVTLVFIVLFFTIIELPALFFLGFWFFQQLAFGALDLTTPTGEGGGVAYFAHIGGFAFGLLTVKLLARKVKTGYDGPRYPVY